MKYADVYVSRMFSEGWRIVNADGDEIDNIGDSLTFLHAQQEITGLAIPGLRFTQNYNASKS